MYYLIFFIVLSIAYQLHVQTIFAYFGFRDEISYVNLFVSVVALLLIALFNRFAQKYNKSDVAEFYRQILFCFVLVPFSVLASFGGVALLNLFVVQIACIIVVIFSVLKIKNRIRLSHKTTLFVLWAVLFVCIVAFIDMLSSGFNLSLTGVYEHRELVASESLSGIRGYIYNWVIKLFIFYIFCFIYLSGKQGYAFVFILASSILFFGVTSHKSVVGFALFSMLLVYFYQGDRFRNVKMNIPLAFSFVVVLLTLGMLINESIFTNLHSAIIRRSFVLPAYITNQYFEFFAENQLIYLSNSFFSLLSTYPYSQTAAKLIGVNMGFYGMSANTGFVGTGFMHFGLAGVFVFSILAGVFISIASSFERAGVAPFVVIVITLSPLVGFLTSADLGASLVTHGLLIAYVLLFSISSFASKFNR
ncbi:O-antigen polymerase [Pseudidiomarina sediminum]|uniref:O-antigen polymerase n=1 Tax=Pseudidiomarina sediminum TaxID=431675 RepID=UPI001C937F20|nr:O-antigen polymerase [Pseudidiomarina sediminum]MBY6063711.1 oligosaccharide repeat unit polymerase [Pseudidiomarina sediminum]